MLQLVGIAVLIALVDLPWLFFTQPYVSNMIRNIQGGKDMVFRLIPAAIVYLALAWLLTVPKTAKEAFLMGFCTYAVFDFTNLALFANYDLRFAIADSLWGGFLFTFVWLLIQRLT